MRAPGESNAINRVLKARGLPSLDEAGVVEALAFQVENDQHFMELLRACEPRLRRDMYEAMSPHLRFVAKPLDYYLSQAQAYASAAELPVMDEQGFLHPYMTPVVDTTKNVALESNVDLSHELVVEVPEVELWARCAQCGKEGIFYASDRPGAIFTMRASGWAYDESAQQRHLCPDCLEAS